LVTGAAGAVGGYAVALAFAAGWRVSGLARAGDGAFVRAAGGELVTELAEGAFDAVLDPAVLGEPAVAAAVDGGHYVGVIPSAPLDSQRGVTVDAVDVVADSALLAELLERSRSGELEVRVAGTAGLEDAATVYAKVAGGGQRGRWLLLP
jgi:NADPH:quinone reductase-like Zn-dependent oxidoreductase